MRALKALRPVRSVSGLTSRSVCRHALAFGVVLGLVLSTSLDAGAASMAEKDGVAGDWQLQFPIGGGFESGDGGVNIYSFNMGARFGYTIPSQVYFGVLGSWHFGTKGEDARIDPDQVKRLEGTLRGNFIFVGAEFGYDFVTGPMLVRPALALGLGMPRTERCGEFWNLGPNECEADTIGKFTLAPGISLFTGVGTFFVGGEIRAIIVVDPANTPDDFLISNVPHGFQIGLILGAAL